MSKETSTSPGPYVSGSEPHAQEKDRVACTLSLSPKQLIRRQPWNGNTIPERRLTNSRLECVARCLSKPHAREKGLSVACRRLGFQARFGCQVPGRVDSAALHNVKKLSPRRTLAFVESCEQIG